MHLIINARMLSSDPGVASLVDRIATMPDHWRYTICTKPGRDANVVYHAVQRSIPNCRIIAAWSEQELMGAAVLGWREPLAVWWPMIDGDPLPDWMAIDQLQRTSEAIYDRTGKQCCVGFEGTVFGEGEVDSACSIATAADCLNGPVLFGQSQARFLLSHDLSKVPNAVAALCYAVAMAQRRCSYVAKEYGLRFSRVDMCQSAAVAAGWRSRVVAISDR